MLFVFFFFNDTATTEIYTLSLHDALPISSTRPRCREFSDRLRSTRNHGELGHCEASRALSSGRVLGCAGRSEEHTSELQSHLNLVCRLLLEKKKRNHVSKSSLKPNKHTTK